VGRLRAGWLVTGWLVTGWLVTGWLVTGWLVTDWLGLGWLGLGWLVTGWLAGQVGRPGAGRQAGQWLGRAGQADRAAGPPPGPAAGRDPVARRFAGLPDQLSLGRLMAPVPDLLGGQARGKNRVHRFLL
jgi:hypothetical protein